MVEAGSLPLHTQTVDIKGQCNIGSPAMPPKVPQKFKFSDLQGFSAFFRESNPRPLVVQAVADATFVPLREVLCRARGGDLSGDLLDQQGRTIRPKFPGSFIAFAS